ncbi:MAG TPA: glycerophosphodiester phosphodiesterase [Candidatus Binatia bacterium]|jgi:glycerophosphoryl diester phosphodiesterase|nr:glycerophosphodiester phosphodiesterase [Candidatus Binatia bacterium]
MTNFFTGSKPRLFAHRGASGEAPENTLVAFRRAANIGVSYVELDVHATHDGQIVVIHDETLERTTNGKGKVQEYTLAELRQLDAGYWFSTDTQQFPFRAAGVRIPTLAEVLREFPQLKFTVEIKQVEPPIEESVTTVVRDCGRAEDVILASEHDRVISRVRTLAPDIATSFATGDVVDFIQRVSTGQLAEYRPAGLALQIPPKFHEVPLVTAETVTAAHALGLEIHVWTINEPQEMERLLDLGVDGIMSDFPGRLREVVRRRS